MTNALSYSSSVRFEGMLRRVLDPLAEEAMEPRDVKKTCSRNGFAAFFFFEKKEQHKYNTRVTYTTQRCPVV